MTCGTKPENQKFGSFWPEIQGQNGQKNKPVRVLDKGEVIEGLDIFGPVSQPLPGPGALGGLIVRMPRTSALPTELHHSTGISMCILKLLL